MAYGHWANATRYWVRNCGHNPEQTQSQHPPLSGCCRSSADIGINRVTDATGNSRLVGDVDFESVQGVAQFLTPVPGGIGPMTVAMLLQNTVLSYSRAYTQDS